MLESNWRLSSSGRGQHQDASPWKFQIETMRWVPDTTVTEEGTYGLR